MDTSIRSEVLGDSVALRYALGTLRITQQELSPQEMVRVINAVRDTCKHCLKYFSGLTEISTLLTKDDHRRRIFVIPKDLKLFGGKVPSYTRCLGIAIVKDEHVTSLPGQELPTWKGFSQIKLFLSEKGQWIISDWKWERGTLRSFNDAWFAVDRRVDLLSDEELTALLVEFPMLAEIILRNLHVNMSQTIVKMHDRLHSLRNAEEVVRGVIYRSGVPVYEPLAQRAR